MGAIDNITDFITAASWSDLPLAIQTKSVSFADGRTLTSGPIEGSGYYDWPAEQVAGKFRWVLEETLDEASVEELIAMARDLIERDDVHDFVRELPLPQPSGRGVTSS